jgi:hypothetical protein
MVRAHLPGQAALPDREPAQLRDPDLDDEAAPRLKVGGDVRKQATWDSCVVRFMMVLKTRYATENVPSTVVVAKSPIATPIASPPGLARSRAAIARDSSMPWTGTPRRASGSAIRPVPMPNSRPGHRRRAWPAPRPPDPRRPARTCRRTARRTVPPPARRSSRPRCPWAAPCSSAEGHGLGVVRSLPTRKDGDRVLNGIDLRRARRGGQ